MMMMMAMVMVMMVMAMVMMMVMMMMMMMMVMALIRCKACQKPFVFKAGPWAALAHMGAKRYKNHMFSRRRAQRMPKAIRFHVRGCERSHEPLAR